MGDRFATFLTRARIVGRGGRPVATLVGLAAISAQLRAAFGAAATVLFVSCRSFRIASHVRWSLVSFSSWSLLSSSFTILTIWRVSAFTSSFPFLSTSPSRLVISLILFTLFPSLVSLRCVGVWCPPARWGRGVVEPAASLLQARGDVVTRYFCLGHI